ERKFSAWPTPPLHLIPWLKRGYDQVYGDCVAVDAMEKSLLAWGKWHRFSMAIAGAASSRLYGRTRGHHGAQGWVRLAAKLATSVFSRRSALHALTHPLRPSERAAALIDEAASGFVERFLEQQRDDFASLPDYNLDTGLVESPAAPTYPLTVATLQRIGRPTAVLAPSERS
ncbi:MAG TPA: hypothetical protein VGE52_17795, partial [Pirellulales bacterium]